MEMAMKRPSCSSVLMIFGTVAILLHIILATPRGVNLYQRNTIVIIWKDPWKIHLFGLRKSTHQMTISNIFCRTSYTAEMNSMRSFFWRSRVPKIHPNNTQKNIMPRVFVPGLGRDKKMIISSSRISPPHCPTNYSKFYLILSNFLRISMGTPSVEFFLVIWYVV